MLAALRLQGVAALALAAPSDGHVDDDAVHAVFQANLEDILGAAPGSMRGIPAELHWKFYR